MWFEHMTGRAHYINKDYRRALKEYKYVQLHAEHIGHAGRNIHAWQAAIFMHAEC